MSSIENLASKRDRAFDTSTASSSLCFLHRARHSITTGSEPTVRKRVQIARNRASEAQRVLNPMPSIDKILSSRSAVSSTAVKEVAPFLRSLRQILEAESKSILRWTSDGRAFEIHDMQRLTSTVLPKYFKHSKYTSFQRQLNYFNFRKWTKSKAVVCTFSNPNFVRDQPALAWRITRKKSLHGHQIKTERSSTMPKNDDKKPTRRTMAIKVPAGATSPSSFPSPTDSFALTSDLNVYSDLFQEQTSESLLDDPSLDWVDALYSSLEPMLDNNPASPSFCDRAFKYTEL